MKTFFKNLFLLFLCFGPSKRKMMVAQNRTKCSTSSSESFNAVFSAKDPVLLDIGENNQELVYEAKFIFVSQYMILMAIK
jgi:hypothetical protein